MSSIGVGMTGAISSPGGLAATRLFSGVGSGATIASLSWTSRMFSDSVVGTANGIVAGVGSLRGSTYWN